MSRAYSKGELAIVPGAISNVAPEGTKVFIIRLGYLDGDASYFFEDANTQTYPESQEGIHPKYKRKIAQMYCVLIDHPIEGLILYDVGPGKPGWEKKWGVEVTDAFCHIDYEDEMQELDKGIAACGYNINDVKHIIMGHLHIDHGGGLEYFAGRDDVTVWAHEIELKHALWSVATKSDPFSYKAYYMYLDLTWRSFDEDVVDLFKGITMHLLPGHTPGLAAMQVNLPNDGTFIFTNDHAHFKESYEKGGSIDGYLLRDYVGWYRSTTKLRRLERNTNARMVYGHDPAVVEDLLKEKPYLS